MTPEQAAIIAGGLAAYAAGFAAAYLCDRLTRLQLYLLAVAGMVSGAIMMQALTPREESLVDLAALAIALFPGVAAGYIGGVICLRMPPRGCIPRRPKH